MFAQSFDRCHRTRGRPCGHGELRRLLAYFCTDWCYDGRISILCPPVCRRQVVSDVFLVTLLAIYILVDRQNGSLFQQNNEQEPSIMSEIEHQVNPTVELHEQIMRMWSETAPLLT